MGALIGLGILLIIGNYLAPQMGKRIKILYLCH